MCSKQQVFLSVGPLHSAHGQMSFDKVALRRRRLPRPLRHPHRSYAAGQLLACVTEAVVALRKRSTTASRISRGKSEDDVRPTLGRRVSHWMSVSAVVGREGRPICGVIRPSA